MRRAGILAVMLLAWAYSRLVAGSDALADVGAVSFSALATLAPALAFAVWRPQTPPRAAIVGIIAAFTVWAWTMLMPMLATASGHSPTWLVEGPFGLSWLSPQGLFGLTGWSALGRAVGASLFVGTLATVLVAIVRNHTPGVANRNLERKTLRDAGLRFLPRDHVEQLLEDAPVEGPVPAAIEMRMERDLSAVLGSASARLLLNAARSQTRELDTVAAIVGEASQDLRFNQQVLEAALNNMSQGISVVDRELRLVAWNARYAEMFGFPPELLQVGRPIEDLTRWALQRMPHRGSGEDALQRRLAYMRAGTAHLTERVFADGSMVEIRGNPMPGGGFVATYTDVTASRQTEHELKQSNETLEQRVIERTALLESAKREAEHANEAKSRFLAAVGHDLLQPLHAAHLFTDSLTQQLPERRETVEQLRGALDSTTDLLSSLLDMSRLQAGGLLPEPRDFPLAEVLEPLASEFGALAGARGLVFKHIPTHAWTHSDPQLLRRILQNFLANAVRYTQHGGIVFGVRRLNGQLRIEVHDSGPGIGAEEQRVIFEEFRRGEDASGQGLGLGLSIAERIATLLHAPLSLRSHVGRGSVFAVSLPMVCMKIAKAQPLNNRGGLAGSRILAVDNDALALQALRRLLEGWGCEVLIANGESEASAVLSQQFCDVWLFDYHLDDGNTGVELVQHLAQRFGARPCLILSADQSETVRTAVREADLPLLAKPLRPLALKSVLDRLLSARVSATV
jgi:PAS domain S-box-containing protein